MWYCGWNLWLCACGQALYQQSYSLRSHATQILKIIAIYEHASFEFREAESSVFWYIYNCEKTIINYTLTSLFREKPCLH